NSYERAIKITDTQLAKVNLTPDEFHGEWNYTIKPSA
ncbi:MAG: ISAzo13-like element transposase-related protein, partial [Solirubrobacteraceae bacterium]